MLQSRLTVTDFNRVIFVGIPSFYSSLCKYKYLIRTALVRKQPQVSVYGLWLPQMRPQEHAETSVSRQGLRDLKKAWPRLLKSERKLIYAVVYAVKLELGRQRYFWSLTYTCWAGGLLTCSSSSKGKKE